MGPAGVELIGRAGVEVIEHGGLIVFVDDEDHEDAEGPAIEGVKTAVDRTPYLPYTG